MKVTIITRSEKCSEKLDYREALQVNIDDKRVFSVSDGEPEDSNLSRDFSDCYNIEEMLEIAFKAGKNGEDFTIIHEESDDI